MQHILILAVVQPLFLFLLSGIGCEERLHCYETFHLLRLTASLEELPSLVQLWQE